MFLESDPKLENRMKGSAEALQERPSKRGRGPTITSPRCGQCEPKAMVAKV